jgi:hypothetical protein
MDGEGYAFEGLMFRGAIARREACKVRPGGYRSLLSLELRHARKLVPLVQLLCYVGNSCKAP